MGLQWKRTILVSVALLAAIGAGAFGFYLYDSTTRTDAPAYGTKAYKVSSGVQRMALQAQFAGPLKDTVIQRWQDPGDGTVCYIYLPVVVEHSAPTPTGYVQYGANGIGSISCSR